MRITQTQELAVAAALVVYIAFTPGFQVVRSFLSTPVGKAIGLAVIVYVWKYVSALVALLLTVSFVRCSGMREGVDETLGPQAKSCPPGYTAKTDMPGKCAKTENGVEKLVDAVAPPTAPPAAPPAPEAPPAATSSAVPMTTPAPPPPPPASMEPVMESFTPNSERDKAGGCSFSPF